MTNHLCKSKRMTLPEIGLSSELETRRLIAAKKKSNAEGIERERLTRTSMVERRWG